jgi:transcription antitermination factor NusG
VEGPEKRSRRAVVLGYCFVRFAPEGKLPVQKVSGVVGLVGSGSQPEPIPEDEITALRTLMTNMLP